MADSIADSTAAATLDSLTLSLKPGISIVTDAAEAGAILQTPYAQLNLSHFSPGLLAALQQLSKVGATESALSLQVMATDGFSGLPKLHFLLAKLIQLGTICYGVRQQDKPFATLMPTVFGVAFESPRFPAISLETGYKLSRFAYSHSQLDSHSDQNQWVLKSPLAQAQIVLHDWRGGAMVAALATGMTGQVLLTEIPGLEPETVQGLLSLLVSCQMVAVCAETGDVDPEPDTLKQWEFHDLIFHTRCRQGRHNQVVGSTYRFRGHIDPLPVIKTQPDEWKKIDLYKPDLEALKAQDLPFTQVLEARRSIRKFAPAPITLEQLGEFLYRSARVRQIFPMENLDCSDRPYPSSGACYEFELYIAVNQCEGLAQGLYHYCPQEHRLGKVRDWHEAIAALLTDASHASRREELPQLLIVIAARFPRLTWKYQSLAYSLILKNLGCLYQTMYLVATAMGLAPCCLGSGNADRFAQIAGTDYWVETSVGEFMLGSQPADLSGEAKVLLIERSR